MHVVFRRLHIKVCKLCLCVFVLTISRRVVAHDLVDGHVGGGSFGNPPKLIARAIAQAHQEYGTSTDLASVVLPLFPIDGIVQGQDFVALLNEEFVKREMNDLFDVVYV